MENENTLYVPDRDQWRDWLDRCGTKEKVIWLIYYKKHTGKPSIPYDDAVEEALCYGWIDSTVRRLDEERYMQQFTPRKHKSNWSLSNLIRVEKMLKAGKMTPRGMELFDYARENGLLADPEEKPDKSFEIPAYLLEEIAKSQRAADFFHSLAPSYKKNYVRWVSSAKQEETRQKRLKTMISRLEEGLKPGIL